MKKKAPALTPIDIPIHEVRGQRVMLDSDLARIYGVETGALNRAVTRNAFRFPPDFLFQLSAEERDGLKCQIGIANTATLTSQTAMPKSGRGGRRTLPYAFTEHGALQAANIPCSNS